MTLTHIFFTAFPAWGHVRPFCILAARLVKERPDVVFTLLISPTSLSKAEQEVLSELRDAASDANLKRIRILSSFQVTSPNPFAAAIHKSVETYAAVYQAIYAGEPVTCATKGTSFDAVPPPSLSVMDFFAYPQLQITRSISGNNVPVFAWVAGKATSIIRMFGPESIGGFGEISTKVEAEAARLGVTPAEIGNKIIRETSGRIIKLPGVPEMYDYEFFPQTLPFDIPLTEILKGSFSFFKDCDGVLSVNTYSLEGEAIAAVREWFSSWNKEVYAIGPMLPLGYGAEAQGDRGSPDIKEFLDQMLIRSGKNSVILISFGTTFWPSDTTYMEEVIRGLIEKKFPFILAQASPFSKISEEIRKEVEASGIGHLTTWCPQQFILDHEATGWFLTHCGHNSVTEAIGSGTPMIAWPFDVGQPEEAYHLTAAGLAIELLQVRTGEHAMKPLRRNGTGALGTREAVGVEIREVIELCRGSKGKEIRDNIGRMKDEFSKAWDADGSARKEFNNFLRKYTDLQI